MIPIELLVLRANVFTLLQSLKTQPCYDNYDIKEGKQLAYEEVLNMIDEIISNNKK